MPIRIKSKAQATNRANPNKVATTNTQQVQQQPKLSDKYEGYFANVNFKHQPFMLIEGEKPDQVISYCHNVFINKLVNGQVELGPVIGRIRTILNSDYTYVKVFESTYKDFKYSYYNSFDLSKTLDCVTRAYLAWKKGEKHFSKTVGVLSSKSFNEVAKLEAQLTKTLKEFREVSKSIELNESKIKEANKDIRNNPGEANKKFRKIVRESIIIYKQTITSLKQKYEELADKIDTIQDKLILS